MDEHLGLERPRRAPGGSWTGKVVAAAALCLCFMCFGGYIMWHCLVVLPHRYALLEATGVRTPATLLRCAPRLGGGGEACTVAMDFRGTSRRWVYPEDMGQFAHLPAGSEVQLLVDPQDPAVAYTVTDVRKRANAGFGAMAGVGALFAGCGIGLAVVLGSAALAMARSAARRRGGR